MSEAITERSEVYRMTMMKITNDDIKTIKTECERIAKKWSRAKRFIIEVGERVNLNSDSYYNIDTTLNIFLITDDPDWNDTDLFTTHEWKEIKNPFELSKDGRAMFDFYIYEAYKGEREELVCNVQAEFDTTGLKAIHADMDKNEWVRK